MLTSNQMNANKTAFITLLKSTNRKGVENVISYLDQGGFFRVPASVHHHNNFEGGLAKHSLEVYSEAMAVYNEYTDYFPYLEPVLPLDSITICALLHDVCKMDVFCMRDGCPHGTGVPNNPHGKKSVRLLIEWGLDLTEDEQIAIAWHMGKWTKDADCQPQDVEACFLEAQRKTPILSVIRRADSLASKKAIEDQMNDE